MRSFDVLATLVAFFAASASSQQYAGEVIDTSLPNVPGSEIAFFKIPGVMDSNKKKAANLTLINYMSHGSDGKRLVESKVQRAVIIVHGLNRDPGTYESNMLSALAQVTGDPNINRDSVAIMSPYFPNGDDKKTGYPWTDGLAAGRGSTTSALVWKGSQWSAGGNNNYPYYSQSTSSYTVLDTLVQYFDDRTIFPNMKQIVVAGHSLGAQTIHRYAALGQKLNTQSPVTYWIGNPNSYVWLSTDRPLSTATCPTYDYYREGYTNFTEYPMTYGQSLVSQGRSAILANYNSKQIAYARGTQDNGDDSSSCAPMTTGSNRNERFFNFIKAFPISCPDPQGSNCDTVDLVNMGHDGGGMFASAAGRARLFTDNFYGNGNRSYDFGYPRQQDGDDPFPDPSLNMTTSSLNNNTYAGNMTYAGCWSEGGITRTFSTLAYDNSANTIELCTSTCVSRGFSIAGLEFGSQCYCGNSMTSGATKVIESSCQTPCAGNSSESCGGMSRLSVFSNGTPYVLPPASNPETVGKFYYSNCYTDQSTRTLPDKVVRGSFMTLEYCADYCSGYKYFGTEYSSECYCGNVINSLATIAPAGECGMTCANNTLEYCGAGNRLTVFTNPDWVQPTGSSTSSTASIPTASGAPSGPACPASNNTVITSNSLKFIVECGIDHAGGDLTTVYDTTFQQCIDACSSNSQCVDVSLSGSACYLKKTVGSAVNIPTVWGARLLTDGSGTTSAISSSSSGTSLSSSTTSLSSSSGTTTSSTTSTSSSSTPSDISCPASDATTYTSPSGQSFVIECGIDHLGGDMGMKYVNSFQQCIDACDQTTGCVDVSLSGTACYLKSTLGSAGSSPSVWGAKLISPSASSTSSGASSSSSSSASSPTSTSTEASSSSSSTSSSASATSTAVSCPASNGALYAVDSGNSFLIECGIDHQGGDLSSKDVKSFADCISLCDTTANCVDVSMVGTACYLKNAVGPVVKLDYVWGAKLVAAAPSSSSSLSTTATIPSSSDVASSTSSSTSSTSESASSSSSSSSPSLTTTTDVTSSDVGSSSTPSSSSTASSSSSSSTLDSTATSTSSLTTSTSDSTTSPSSTPTSTSSGTTDSSLTSSSSTSTEITSSSSSSSASDSSASSASSTSTSSTSASQTTTPSSTSNTLDASSASTDSTSSMTSSSTTSSSSSATSLFSSTTTSSSSSASGFVTSTSSTTTSSAASSSTAALPAGFSYAGCFIDGSTRALPISVGTSSTQTQQQCAMSCQAKGYKYSGTEYAQECWCGNSIPSSSAPESQCSMACKGDSTQKCGAGNRLSVVSDDSWKQTFFARQSFGAWNLQGCYTDSTAKRSLPTSVSLAAYGGGANATIANCVQACQAKGFAYCGAEYYSECFGSNVAPLTNLAGSDPLAAGCNYPCKGNSTESCGGSSRIIVYSNTGS